MTGTLVRPTCRGPWTDTFVQALLAEIHGLTFVQALPAEIHGLTFVQAVPAEIHGLTVLFNQARPAKIHGDGLTKVKLIFLLDAELVI